MIFTYKADALMNDIGYKYHAELLSSSIASGASDVFVFRHWPIL